jgi:hypothetical protein
MELKRNDGVPPSHHPLHPCPKNNNQQWREIGGKYKTQIVIFCILATVNRFSWISWKAESR